MVGGIYGGYGAKQMYGTQSYLSQRPSAVNNYDYKAAQKEMKSYIDQYKKNQGTVSTLKKDTAQFLDDYSSDMTNMKKAAQAVSGGEFDKLLYGKEGTGSKPTDENVDKTAAAVEKLVAQFNSTLTNLNKNAERGGGVSKQIGRMVSSPTSTRSMEQIGITTQKDGTLKVDMDKLKKSLKENTSVARDVIGGNYGMAQGISRDATNGLSQSPISLVGNDIAAIKEKQQMSESMTNMSNYSRTGAINMMNMNSVGLLMNMMI